jgi:GntR family transcriptional regulator/MocR family aminotransferase
MSEPVVDDEPGRRALGRALELDRHSPTPFYRQVYGLVRDAIARDVLRPGERLPSTRSLASQLATARGTIDLAYSLLASEGYILARGAAGTFVAASLSSAVKAPAGAAPPAAMQQKAANALVLRPFEMGFPALDAFPRKLWSRLAARRARLLPLEALWHPGATGALPLREAIAAYLAVSRSIRCSADQIIITAGFQGALGLATRAFLEPGNEVWFEDPGYILARRGFQSAGARLVPVPVDEEGLDVDAGVARCPKARLAYVTPSHQAPLGVALSLRRRLALLNWAERARAWILEDDYDSEFRYASRPLPALKSLDEADRVLFVGSFSKVLFPGLKLGYLVIPRAEVDRISRICLALNPGPATLSQAIVADFMVEGCLPRHIRRMRSLYAERRAALANALTAVFGNDLDLRLQAGGMHLIARIMDGSDDLEQVDRANAHGLAPMALSTWCMMPEHQRQGLLLSFTNMPVSMATDHALRLKAALGHGPD